MNFSDLLYLLFFYKQVKTLVVLSNSSHVCCWNQFLDTTLSKRNSLSNIKIKFVTFDPVVSLKIQKNITIVRR